MTDDATRDADEKTPPDPQHAWQALSNVSDWIRHGDAKIGVTLAFAAGAATLLFSLVDYAGELSAPVTVLCSITAAALLASAGSALVGLVPQVRIGGRRRSESHANLLFYRHIARGWKDREADFIAELALLTAEPTSLTTHLSEQIFANASVADRKFKHADRALRFLAIGLLGLALAAIGVTND